MARKIDDKTVKAQNKKDGKIQTLTNVGLAGAAHEVVQRFGSANKEFLVAYGGVDNEIGKTLTKSFKEESRRLLEEAKKIIETVSDPEQRKKLLHQLQKSHSGFISEVDEVALENSKRIINKDSERVIRMDDLDKSKGGQRNHPLYDHVVLDENGNPIHGSASQMKMRGESAQEVHDKLMAKGKNGKNEKYLDQDVKIKVQKEFADEVRKIAKERIKELKQQEKALIDKPGKEEELKKIRRKIFKEGRILKNTEASNVSNQESKDIIFEPKRTTAKYILKISHDGATERAKTGALIGGSMSFIKNVVAVVKEEKEAKDAVFAVVKDTGSAAALSYGTAFSGAVIKGIMQNAKSTTMRALAKTGTPAMIVTVAVETGKTLSKYIKGEIDGVQCLEELGEKGTGMASSALFIVIGQMAIPIPVIGGMIGGMVGYALSSACYGQLTAALKGAKIAREQRIEIEAECAEAISMIKEYRTEIEEAISKYLSDHIKTFRAAFGEMQKALNDGDIDRFIAGTNILTGKLGGKPQFIDESGFNEFMLSPDKLILVGGKKYAKMG
jgi:hypothetical protein